MDRQDLLLEIGCEELPTHAVKFLSNELARTLTAQLRLCGLIDEKFTLNGLSATAGGTPEPQIFATPRRIAVLVKNVATQMAAKTVERQGPMSLQAHDKQGNPTPAALGFAKSCGVNIAEITQKNERLYFKAEQPGAKTLDILPTLIRDAIHHMTITKPMRWGIHPESFARPVHWLVLMFGAHTIKIELFGVHSNNQTYGHRFHHPQALTITSPQDYARILEDQGNVIAAFSKRRDIIRQAIRNITPKNQIVAVEDDLLDEVTSLVEWPVALIGHFNPDFLKVPAEALITSMKINQKYFPVLSQQELQPTFVLISNIEGTDPALIVHGNERVLNARLADAAFFFKNDCEHSLESRLPHLEQVTFQKQLGSLADKTERMVTLVTFIGNALKENSSVAKQAAQLCKCDLLSEMVGEFPTLQGIMGYYYAKNDGLSEECALAIKEHYYPRFSGDTLPTTTAGSIVALADRLDTLVGIFGINQAPTGDKDPFALRRAALGILRILIEKKLPLDLEQLLQRAQQAYTAHLPNTAVVTQTFDFMMSRLKAWCLEKGISAEVFEAVLACRPTTPLDFTRRVNAVEEFLQKNSPTANALAAANKRVSHILKKQAGDIWPTAISPQLFEHEAERVLAQQLTLQTKIVNQLYSEARYTEALDQLSSLKEPVDTFFDKVMVMVDDKAKRENRLALLAGLHHLFTRVADISLLTVSS